MDNNQDSTENSQVLPNGYQLKDYRIERVLGVGGFGVTYLVAPVESDATLKQVIKECLPLSFAARNVNTRQVTAHGTPGNLEWAIDSFIKEARVLRALDHPNIVKVSRAFKSHGTADWVLLNKAL